MVRSILACAAVTLMGLAQLASAALYEDFLLDTEVALTYASPASVLETILGTVDETKAACDAAPTCIAVLYQESAGGAQLLRYDAAGSSGGVAGFSSVSWRYDAPSAPSCNSQSDGFANASGQCICEGELEQQNTNFGCRIALLPSGIIERRGKRMARNHIMPGRAATPLF